MALPEVRIMLMGGRWSGKSSTGNTIMGEERFECGRVRTPQVEVRHKEVQGRQLRVVDVPGWNSALLSLNDTPETDKLNFKLSLSRCLPGPHVFLLVIPADSAFSKEERKPLEEHMKLFGERVWRHAIVLFTCGDFLVKETIEQHIEQEGEALQWLVGKCGNRYHVFNNKNKNDSVQVRELLKKMEEMVCENNGGYYEVDESTLLRFTVKQKEAAERANKRQKKASEQRQQLKAQISEAGKQSSDLRMVLLGSRSVGKSSTGNTILGSQELEDGKRTAHSIMRWGHVDKTAVTLVDTPGWWKGFSVADTPELIKQELMRSMFLCPPGPHVFLLVIDADASFNKKHLEAVTGHLELLGGDVWNHTIVVFARGDWLGMKTIEQHIEGEGEALQSLVDKCGNRYHVFNNKNRDDGTQVTELLEKIKETVAGNGGGHFVPDEKMHQVIKEKSQRVEEGAKRRQTQVKKRLEKFRGIRLRNQLPEIRIVMVGQKTVGKSTTGNTILHQNVFATCENIHCEVGQGEVDGRKVTIIDSPGWWKNPSRCTEEQDREIVQGVSLCSPGAHALLLVIPIDMAFTEEQKRALEEHMGLFGDSVWNHTLVLFTYGDRLEDKTIEEHIERESFYLQWLVDKCGNRYHVLNNMRKNDVTQVSDLLEKIEEMVAGNNGHHFSADMEETYRRVEENSKKREVKQVLKQGLVQEFRMKEVEQMIWFRETLIDLETELKGSKDPVVPKRSRGFNPTPGGDTKTILKVIGAVHKDGKKREEELQEKIREHIDREEKLQKKIRKHIEKLDKDIGQSTIHFRSSMGFIPPYLSGESLPSSVAGSFPDRPVSNDKLDDVLAWLSTLQIDKNADDQLTLTFSQTSSGYRSLAGCFDPKRHLHDFSHD